MQACFALASWSSLPEEGEPQVNSYYPHPRWIARLHDGFQFEFQTLFSPLIDLDYDDTIIGYISYPSKYMGGIPRQGYADRETPRQEDTEEEGDTENSRTPDGTNSRLDQFVCARETPDSGWGLFLGAHHLLDLLAPSCYPPSKTQKASSTCFHGTNMAKQGFVFLKSSIPPGNSAHRVINKKPPQT